MGESDRYQDYKMARRRFTLGQPGNALFALFAVNVSAFFLILLINVFLISTSQSQYNTTSGNVMQWFALPGNWATLIEKPWTLLTFMFSQGGNPAFAAFITMLGNMLWLWAFGYLLQDLSGNRHIFPVYIYGSLLGALLFLLSANLMPALSQNKNNYFLFSAQCGTTAIAVAVTALSPYYRLFRNIGNGIPVWVLTAIYLLVNFIYAFRVSGALCFAIVGAAIAGFGFIYLIKKGKDAGAWMHSCYNWFSNFFKPIKNKEQNRLKEKVFYNTGGTVPFSKKSNLTQQRIDEILDKINQKGYQFLTDEEKAVLKRASEEDV